MPSKQMKILVTGATGVTGRAVVKELLDRGHKVTGLSRNPERWGSHANYTPLKGSQSGPVDELTKAVEGHDAVVSAFAPSHLGGGEVYGGLIEGAWRIKAACKAASNKPYLVYVGGAGSLVDPVTGKVCLDQIERTWTIYLYEGPIEHVKNLAKVIGMGIFHFYAHLREVSRQWGPIGWLASLYTSWFERTMVKDTVSRDVNLSMPHACRVNVAFFEHDETFNWSFLSPPWFYRAGPKTGTYGTLKEYQPVTPKGRWLGIYNGDLAVAVADEAIEQKKKWVHWSCFGPQADTAYYYSNYEGVVFERYELK